MYLRHVANNFDPRPTARPGALLLARSILCNEVAMKLQFTTEQCGERTYCQQARAAPYLTNITLQSVGPVVARAGSTNKSGFFGRY